MKILGIETSCDETAVAVVDVARQQVLAERVYSQFDEHEKYGGVVPEIASRAHLERLPTLTHAVLDEVGGAAGVDAVAAAVGPGLVGALLMGATFGKTLALGWDKPFVGVNHLEGHALSPMLTEQGLDFPYLLLLVSGGHCQFVRVTGVGQYVTLGSTVDDAAGECFDKVGKLLGLGHPAGPQVEQLAKQGAVDSAMFRLPKDDGSLDFSFSGLKTAVRQQVVGQTLSPLQQADVAASFQHTVATIMAKKAAQALQETGLKNLVVAGGVAANATIRSALEDVCVAQGAAFFAPPLKYCTDNAAMIAYAGGRQYQARGADTLAVRVVPRWPLDMLTTGEQPR